jgi:acetoin utilization protein AcuC
MVGGDGAAVAALYADDAVLAMQELVAAGRRLLYLDIDAHHGDGPEAAFYDSAEVMTISLHQSGRTLFPGSGFEEDIGVGAGRGFAANLPLPPGTDDQAYLRAFHEGAWPLIEAFSADVVVVEVGMDTLAGDPLTMMRLTNQAPMEVLECVRQLGKPMLATGGGGYHFENTVRGWVLAWSGLCGDQAEHDALAMSMGGVMMQSDDWVGGLRDRALPRDPSSAELVDREVERMLQRLKRSLFDLHGLPH